MAERIQDSPAAKSIIQRLRDWGSSSLPPALLASLITALHARPAQPLALVLFPGPLLFASYINLAGHGTGAAGISAAWSGIYALLALRRRQSLRGKFSARGLVRGAAIALCMANCLGGGLAYALGSFEKDEEERKKRNRWAGDG
ncbi:hypothetical protein CDD82_94 [Ophiocordyceps australis]|uniref:Uncharacterized protein n=1 Tax=Ophiocordyceps australis TaxID=1399860 RepID=A0A2C5YJZ0_9HYPO|nr:hypothetical protein CDD82_94 [Ophiocordyceps australis]